jgi:hypothetical protein
MRAPRSDRRSASPSLRTLAVLAAAACAAGPVVACGLDLSGLGAVPGDAGDASPLDAARGDGASSADGAVEGGSVGSPDSGGDDAPGQVGDAAADAGADAAPACTPFDAGISGALALSAFTLANATYNENLDGRITLTNSYNNQAGAAWYPTEMPAVAGYDLTWSFRVGPGDTSGEGITFAVLASVGAPGAGASGAGLGLQNVAESGGDGGVPSGYAVAVDMFQEEGDPTSLGPVTLKLVTMPGFTPVAETLVPFALNDGNVYAVNVAWRAPSTLTATLHAGPDAGTPVTVTSSNPGLAAPAAYLGFTASTGSSSDSHNEIAGITVSLTCE